MTKALLWASCCLLLFLAFLWLTSRPKSARVRDLTLSQPAAAHPAKLMEKGESITKISKDRVVEPEKSPVNEPVPAAPVPPPGASYQPARPPPLDMERFAVDEILALPLVEQKKFLNKNQVRDLEKFTRFQNITQLSVIDQYLKGDFTGKIEGKSGEEWHLHLNIDGEVEKEHFAGEIAVELLDKDQSPISRSHLKGPLDDHIRVVDTEDRSSLLLQIANPENPRFFQIFIGGANKERLVGNYYARNGEGKLQMLGSFVLKKGDL